MGAVVTLFDKLTAVLDTAGQIAGLRGIIQDARLCEVTLLLDWVEM